MGMKSEIEQALEAHAAWRKHFKDFLHGKASFDVALAGVTDQCAFGKWLDHEGDRLMPEDLHGDICAAHAAFHQTAAEIVQKIKEKRFAEAHADVAPDGALNHASEKLAKLLLKASLREPGHGGATPNADAEKAAETAPEASAEKTAQPAPEASAEKTAPPAPDADAAAPDPS